ncbi:MAG: mechanosensitive ion channel family protein [Planctomycetaceae bacterium]
MPDQPIVEQTVDQSLRVAHTTAVESIDRALRGDPTIIADLAIGYLVPAALSLVAVFIGYLAAKYLARVVSGPICKRVDETLGKFVGRVVFYAVLLSAVAMVLSQVGIRMGGVATVLAATGFAVGLAFQGTLSNFAAGVLLLVFRPFKVGDVINAAGMMGKVNEIDLFTTTLDTPDNRRIIVPNSSISGGTIENVSYHKQRRVEVVVGVAYAASLDATRSALTRAAESLADKTITGEGRGFAVVLATLADSSVQWKVRLWVSASDFWPVTEQLTAAVKRELDAVDISIAFPQLDVHLHRVDDKSEATAVERLRPRLSVTARTLRQEAS